MQINVKIDASELQARTEREAKRLAYATSNALNHSAEFVQAAERDALYELFTIRNKQFMERLIKIFQFASPTKGVPYVIVGIDISKQRTLLSIFEAGGVKLSFKGKHVAVPLTGSAARRSFGQSVAPSMTFKELAFKRVATTQAGKALKALGRGPGPRVKLTAGHFIWAGRYRTFILPETKKAPLGGVFQRVGPGRDDIRMIYSFKQNPRLRKLLGFVARATTVFNREFNKQFTREMAASAPR